MSETTYYVDILGQLWQGCPAATSRIVRHADIMQLPQAAGETDADYLVRMIECALDTGDFQSVTALRIDRKTVTPTGPRSFETAWATLQDFAEDDEFAFSDCFAELEDA